ncbi:MAG: helix-turn-helix domain-containing protein [Abditibacteriota bacterium]|nr:helix-turn-helix domain-containing protein [Abditibacteriota bacterium]
MDAESRKALTVEGLASALDIGKSSAYRLIRSGAIRYTRIGKLIRIPADAVDEFLQKSSVESKAAF